jgi:hypothetical protein
MSIRSILMESPRPVHWAYRYGMLAVIFVLLAQSIHWLLALPPAYPYDHYGNLVVVLMLLFNHVAYLFKWPRPVAIAPRLLAWGWLAFGFFYIFYWSHVLYPIGK